MASDKNYQIQQILRENTRNDIYLGSATTGRRMPSLYLPEVQVSNLTPDNAAEVERCLRDFAQRLNAILGDKHMEKAA